MAYAVEPPVASSICAAPGVNPRVSTHLSAPLKSPRVYFRAGDTGPEYYVDLFKGAGDEYWAIMPAPESATRSITYRIAAQDANGNWVNGTPMHIGVSATCPANKMSSTEQVASDNIILGLTDPAESALPTGFSCKGVKSVIASNGQMRPAEECRVAMATAAGAGGKTAGAAGATAAAHTAGLTAAQMAALGLVVAGASYAAGKHQGENKNKSPKSP
jgi:hypothetical protein